MICAICLDESNFNNAASRRACATIRLCSGVSGAGSCCASTPTTGVDTNGESTRVKFKSSYSMPGRK